MIEITYYPHNNNFRNTPEGKYILKHLNKEGYGNFHILNEILSQSHNLIDLNDICQKEYLQDALELTDQDKFLVFINILVKAKVINLENNIITSPFHADHIEKVKDKLTKRQIAGSKGGKVTASRRNITPQTTFTKTDIEGFEGDFSDIAEEKKRDVVLETSKDEELPVILPENEELCKGFKEFVQFYVQRKPTLQAQPNKLEKEAFICIMETFSNPVFKGIYNRVDKYTAADMIEGFTESQDRYEGDKKFTLKFIWNDMLVFFRNQGIYKGLYEINKADDKGIDKTELAQNKIQTNVINFPVTSDSDDLENEFDDDYYEEDIPNF